MKFDDWHVMQHKESGLHNYFYGDLEDFSTDDLEDMTEISPKNYSSIDIATIFSNILEDNNRHSLTDIGFDIIDAIRETHEVSSEIETKIIKNFVNKMLSKK